MYMPLEQSLTLGIEHSYDMKIRGSSQLSCLLITPLDSGGDIRAHAPAWTNPSSKPTLTGFPTSYLDFLDCIENNIKKGDDGTRSKHLVPWTSCHFSAITHIVVARDLSYFWRRLLYTPPLRQTHFGIDPCCIISTMLPMTARDSSPCAANSSWNSMLLHRRLAWARGKGAHELAQQRPLVPRRSSSAAGPPRRRFAPRAG